MDFLNAHVQPRATISICNKCDKPFNLLARDQASCRFKCSACRVKTKLNEIVNGTSKTTNQSSEELSLRAEDPWTPYSVR